MVREWSVPALAIGKVTFREITQDKVLYNAVVCAVLLLGLSFMAGEFAVIVRERVMIDLRLSALTLSCAMIAIFVGASVLPKEFDRRTALVALSRPISRHQFVCGKFVGLVGVIAVNWAFLASVLFVILTFTSDSPMGVLVSGSLLMGVCFALLQAILLAALALSFSSFTTTSLSVIFTLGLFMAGHNISQMRWLSSRLDPGSLKILLDGAALALPNLEYFDLGTKVSYGLPVTWQFGLTALVYGVTYSAVLILIAGQLVRVREG